MAYFIAVEKGLIPYEFEIVLAGKTFTFAINYNAEQDFFTVDLYRNNRPVVIGEKVVYGRPLFITQQYADIPEMQIIPYDPSGKESRVTWHNLNDTVFLWLVNEND